MKHIRDRDMMEYINDIAGRVLHSTLTETQFASIMNYIFRAGVNTQRRDFLEELTKKIPQRKGTLMTIAEQLIAEGVQKGLAEGLQQGRKAGRKGFRRALRKGYREVLN